MMLGARTGAWAKSGGGLPTAKDYVQNGLVAMWDGIENAGWGVHNPNATVWKDLVGDCDFTLSGVSFDADRAIFNGYGYGTSPIGNNLIEKLYNCVIEIVVRFIEINGFHVAFSTPSDLYESPCVALGANTSPSWRRLVVCSQRPIGAFSNIDGYPYSFSETSTITTRYEGRRKPNYCVRNGNQAINLNGVEYGSNNDNTNRILLGCRDGSYANRLNGEICCLRAYSELTNSGIATNYAIDKARFNLP